MMEGLFDYLSRDQIVTAFERSLGNEFASGKFASPESSAALAANTFGFFLNAPQRLPHIPNTDGFGWPAREVTIEQCVRFPWRGGRHPWLDAFVVTTSHIIGIESKRYEPFRTRKPGYFSSAYWRPVWGQGMSQFEEMRDQLANESIVFERLDGHQLVKHAFGLVSEAKRRQMQAALVYLYAEPDVWPNELPISEEMKRTHMLEIKQFAETVAGADVAFCACSYRKLLSTMKGTGDGSLRKHAIRVSDVFKP